MKMNRQEPVYTYSDNAKERSPRKQNANEEKNFEGYTVGSVLLQPLNQK